VLSEIQFPPFNKARTFRQFSSTTFFFNCLACPFGCHFLEIQQSFCQQSRLFQFAKKSLSVLSQSSVVRGLMFTYRVTSLMTRKWRNHFRLFTGIKERLTDWQKFRINQCSVNLQLSEVSCLHTGWHHWWHASDVTTSGCLLVSKNV